MNRILKQILLVAIALFSLTGYSQTLPVTATSIIGYPASVFLTDYYLSGSNKLTANLILNDFNVPSRDVFLKIRIESDNIRISTKPDYVPAAPLTLYPGVPVVMAGDDLEEYLNYNNIVIEGYPRNELITSGGRLPEGFYSLCIEVYDYSTKRLLSNSACALTHISLLEPPHLISPEKGKMIAPASSQNILFQWINEAPVDPSAISYKFTLYELIDPNADPMQAVGSNQSLIIYEEEVTVPMFNYNTSHPLLELGKTYIWTVQSISNDGRGMFKNNGVSEPLFFYYGYPGNGNIELLSPENNSALQLTLEKTFSWSAPDKLLAGQTYIYEIRIAQIDSIHTPEELLQADSLLYSKTTNICNGSSNYFLNAKAFFPTGKNFVWQVKAYSGEQEIAKSEVHTFGGPPCILDFIAADEYVSVTFTDGCNLLDLSGRGNVALNKSGLRHDVVFNHVRIVKDGVQYYLMGGEVLADLTDMEPYKLKAEYARNGEALFYPDSLKMTKYDFLIKGRVEWNFPHAANQDDIPTIQSKHIWLGYEDYTLLGKLPFNDSTTFELLDPMGFQIDFNGNSEFYIRGENNYSINFTGQISIPENIRDSEGKQLIIPFNNHEQIFTIYSDSTIAYQSIHVAKNTTLYLTPRLFVFDFDNSVSPAYFASSPAWRGFYIHKGIYSFQGDYSFSKQFASFEPLEQYYNFESKAGDHAYIIHDGLYVKSDIGFDTDNKLFFNTFPAYLNNFHIEVAQSRTVSGKLTGEIVIPLLSDKENFPFTCNLSQLGFSTGYLNESIENKTFTFNNEGGEQKMFLTFNRGFFADNERLETTLTLGWPYVNLTFEKLPAFRIWGNYDIGFGMPNGAYTLAQQMRSRIKGYEITIDGMGAGRQGNLYSIGTTANIVMGEDVSGETGPPVVNLYSIFESSKIDENYILGNSPDYSNGPAVQTAEGYAVDENIGQAAEGEALVGDIDAIVANYEKKQAQAQAKVDSLKPKPAVGKAPPTDNLQGDFAALIPDSADVVASEDPLGTLTYQELIQIIDFVAPFLEEEQQRKVLEFKELLVTFSPEEIQKVIDKLKDIRGLLNKAIKSMIDAELAKVTSPIKQKVDQLNKKVEGAIVSGTDSLVAFMGGGIDVVINGFTDAALEVVQAGHFENADVIIGTINQISVSSRNALKTELHRTVTNSVKKNIIVPCTGIIDTVLYTGSVLYLSESLSQNAADLITKKDFKFSDIDIDFDGMVDSMSNYLSDRLNFEYFKNRITNTIDDAISGFNWDSVSNVFFRDLVGSTLEQYINNQIVDVVTDIAGETAGAIAGGLAQNVELDFSNLGDKLKSGDIGSIVKFDPSYIKIVSPSVDMEGYVKFYNDDPVWGDSWQASLNATVKIPDPKKGFTVFAKYINGTKPKGDVVQTESEAEAEVETYKFWFFQIGVMGLKVQLGPLPVMLTGLDGKIYHHMVKQPDLVTYLPDDSVRYGAGLRFYMVDAASAGKVADFNVGFELEIVDGGFVFEMNGQANIANKSATIGGGKGGDAAGATSTTGEAAGDKKGVTLDRSLILAGGFIRYNSIDKHLLGNMYAKANTAPLLCAGGQMIIDISKDWWQFAIGTRPTPVSISVFCKDTIFRGWFDINKNGLDMGLMTNLHIDLRSPWIDLGFVEFRGWVVIGFDFETELVIIWNPEFGIQKARIFIDFYAGVGIDWKTFIKSGSFTIAAINLGGELEFATIPEAYLRGEIHGKITILGISAGMKLSANINL